MVQVCMSCDSFADTLNGLCCDCARLQAEGQCEREQAEGACEVCHDVKPLTEELCDYCSFHFGDTVTPDGLEYVFPQGNQWRNRIFYDPKVGEYYDRGGDMYLTLEQMGAFGQVFRV